MCPPEPPFADPTTQTGGAPLASSVPSSAVPSGDLAPDTVLGDFRIVREVGRGGMGVVYEAVQVSLGRRVALKVLPNAFSLDSRRLQRFKNEAHAAACLHHTNIVPVYGTGSEGGVHYYAMQFVHGATLADLLRELRSVADPTPTVEVVRTRPGASPTTVAEEPRPAALLASGAHISAQHVRHVAWLGLQAAEALQHAHEQGVLHRDIKPANLMVEPTGHLWVTDFGLAQLQGDPGLTATGDLVGTLRYMSPEQALAKRVPVDHRTDVYSLGATLYELFTLQPALTGSDRSELLHNIAFEEPISPRRLNPALPRDAETILLKALAKSAGDRYATAQDLADDLRRFLDDKPIQARRPTLGQRLARWARRHRAIAATAGLTLVLAVVGLALSTWLIWREKEKTQAERDRFEQEKFRAERGEERARQEARKAQEMLGLGLAALNSVHLAGAEERMPRTPLRSKEDAALLRQALAFYQAFAQKAGNAPRVRAQVGTAQRRVAEIRMRLGQYPQAEKAIRSAIATFEDLIAREPREILYREALARAYNSLGVIHDLAGKDALAEKAHRQCLKIRRALAREYPRRQAYRSNEAAVLHNLAMLRKNRRDWEGVRQLVGEAIVAQRMAVKAEPRNRVALHHLHNHLHLLANALLELERPAEAEKALTEALRLAGTLMKIESGSLEAWLALAQSHANLGSAQGLRNDLGPALANLEKAVAMRGELLAEYPRLASLRSDLATTYLVLGRVQRQKGLFDKALASLGRAVQLGDELVRRFPRVPSYRKGLLLARSDQVELLRARGRLAEAEKVLRDDVALAELLLREAPRSPEARLLLARQLDALGRLLSARGDFRRATAHLERAVKTLRALAAEFPRHSAYQKDLAGACHHYGICLRNADRLGDSLAVLEEACAIYRKRVRQPAAPPSARRDLAWVLTERGITLMNQKRLPAAEASHREGLKLQRALVEEDPTSADDRCELGGILNNLANVFVQRKDWARARRLLEEAVGQQRAALKIAPNDLRALRFFRSHHRSLANVLEEMNDFAGAAAVCERAARVLQGRVEVFGGEGPYCRAMSRLYRKRGGYLLDLGQFAEAEPALRQALALHRRLSDPGPPDRSAYGICLFALAKVMMHKKQPAEACRLLEKAAEEHSAAWKAQPKQNFHRIWLVRDLRLLGQQRLAQGTVGAAARTAEALAVAATADWSATFAAARLLEHCRAAVQKKAPEQARAYARRVRELRIAAVRCCPGRARDLNPLAWELATAPEEALRDPAEAVRLAGAVVRHNPRDVGTWNTLGIAHYRAGEWEKALQALDRSLVLRGGGDAYDWLFGALALERLDRSREARCWYARSVAWMELHPSKSPELRRFRAEADAVFAP